jgi:hypothetical protein
MGGVYNSININVYCYGGLNPVKFVDPDGKLIGYPWVSLIDVKRQKANSTENNSSQLISSRVRQNDSRLNPAGDSACRYRSLQSIAESYMGQNLTTEQINAATESLAKSGAIRLSDYYVNDAVAVIKDALTRLGADVSKIDISVIRKQDVSESVYNKLLKNATATLRGVPNSEQMNNGQTGEAGHWQHGDASGGFIWDPWNGTSSGSDRPINRLDIVIIKRKEE